MDPALSPDGTRLAFARWDAPHGVYVLDLASGREQRVAVANQPRHPTWSPDETRVAFGYLSGSFTCRATPFGCYSEDLIRDYSGGEDCADTPYGYVCIDDFQLREVGETWLAQVTLSDDAWLDLASQAVAQSPDWHPLRDEIVYRGRGGLHRVVPGAATRALVDNPDVSSPAWAPDSQRIAAQVHLHDRKDLLLFDGAGNLLNRLTQPAEGYQRAANNVIQALFVRRAGPALGHRTGPALRGVLRLMDSQGGLHQGPR